MKQFFKDHSSFIVSLLVTQLAMSIFGLVLSFACAQNTTLLILASVLSIIFYLYLLFFKMYELGQKDGIRIEGGRLKYQPWKGFWIDLAANLLNFLLGIMAIVGKACIREVSMLERLEGYDGDALTPSWAVQLYEIGNTGARFIQAMYTGLIRSVAPGNVFMLLVIPLPAILLCAVAYPLGVRYCNGISSSKKRRGSNRYQ